MNRQTPRRADCWLVLLLLLLLLHHTHVFTIFPTVDPCEKLQFSQSN